MGKMSRQKGARFEVEVAKQFTEWTGMNVRRTPRSGAYGGENWKSLTGDLMFDHDWPYVVELKNRESWKLEDVFAGKGEVWEWWTKLREEATVAKKKPMLIIKKNRVEPMVMLLGYDPLAYTAATKAGDTRYACIGGRTLLWLSDVLKCEPPGERRVQHATEEDLPWPLVGG